jgi:hypothetical protein
MNEPATPKRVTSDRASELEWVKEEFQKALHLPDCGALEMCLGAYAANRMEGDPVWLMVVGPPSGGKGEQLTPLSKLRYVHQAAQVSEASLLSGTPKKEHSQGATGGLLKAIGSFGILHMKDFTSVFTMNRDEKGKAISALRQVYDGRWDRPIGAGGARTLSWEGKLGLIAGVTESIDSEHALMSKLGPRFILFRMPKLERDQQARKALGTNEHVERMRRNLREIIEEFFSDFDFSQKPSKLSKTDENWLVRLADFSTAARSSVERAPYTHEIEQIPESEGPGRLIRALQQLWAGLELIGVDHSRRRYLIQKAALDSIPPIRRICINYLSEHGESSSSEISDSCRYSHSTIARNLEDLQCHSVVELRKVARDNDADEDDDAEEKNRKKASLTRWSIVSAFRDKLVKSGILPESVNKKFVPPQGFNVPKHKATAKVEPEVTE